MMRDKKLIVKIVIGMIALAGLLCMTGCGEKAGGKPEQKEPVVITLWHSYNALVKMEFDRLVMEFNETLGAEKGIIVDTQGYGSSEDLADALYDSANKMTGADPLPDIFAAYPDSAYRLDEIAPLVKLDDYFTREELEEYRPEFLEEGIWEEEGSPKMLPVAKSTELLYLNRTDWDRFAGETGASIDLLETWEGLCEAAGMYYEWSGGKPFLGINAYNDFAVLSAAQAGEEPYDESGAFHYSEAVAKRAWDAYYVPHIKGWYKSNVYNQDGIKSGNLIAYIGSSAGASYFPEDVIANENESYPIECQAFRYPVFQGGLNYMTQRGANMAIFASDQIHESSAAEFLKWMTEPDKNIKFAVATGYLPVENKALESFEHLSRYVHEEDNVEAVRLGLEVSLNAMESGIFYSRKPFKGSYMKNNIFSESLSDRTHSDLLELEANKENREEKLRDFLSDENFENWYQTLLKEMGVEVNE